MKEINYEFLNQIILDLDILNMISYLHEYKGKQELYLQSKPQILEKLVDIAKIQSTDKSNKIEGIKTTNKRLKEIVNKKAEPKNRNEEEIAGYREVLDMIHTSYDNIRFMPNDILTLHKYLYKFSPNGNGGKYKITNNYIQEEDNAGNRFIRFQPVEAMLAEEYINKLCGAYNDVVDNTKIDVLLLIPCVILDFLCIHPFSDGNGRMSRLLTLLLLYKAGYLAGKYISIEMIIEKTKDTYYEALYNSSIGWHENENTYIPFLKYMLGVLIEAYKEFEDRFKIIQKEKIKSSDRVYEVINRSLAKITKADLITLCPEISKKTIERALNELLNNGRIKMVGAGRSSAYISAERISNK